MFATGTLLDWQADVARTKKKTKDALHPSILHKVVCIRIGRILRLACALGSKNLKANGLLVLRDSELKLALWR